MDTKLCKTVEGVVRTGERKVKHDLLVTHSREAELREFESMPTQVEYELDNEMQARYYWGDEAYYGGFFYPRSQG